MSSRLQAPDRPDLDERHIVRPRGQRRALRFVGALLALAALVAFLVAVPTGLWLWRHNPLPTTWDPARWWDLAQRGFVHPDLVPNVVAAVCWICWAQLVLSLAREATARVRRGAAATRSALLLPPVQQLACRWVAAAWLAVAATARPEVAESLPAFIKAPPAATANHPNPPSAVTAGPLLDVDPARVPAAESAGSSQRYVCDRYDTLRSLASGFYGDANRWTVIRDASVGLPQPDGTRLRPGFVAVRGGAVLTISVGAASGDSVQAVRRTARSRPPVSGPVDAAFNPAEHRHVVRPGDTLWDIAEAAYPDAKKRDLPRIVAAIFSANRGVADRHGQILRDPDLIYPGMILRLPSIGSTPDGRSAGTTTQRRHAEPPQTQPDDDEPTAPPSAGAETQTPPPGAPTPPREAPTPPRTPSPPGGVAAEPTEPVPETDPWIQPPLAPAAVWVGAGTLLVTAFVAVSRSRRNRRDGRVRPGRAAPPPDPALVPLHADVLRADNPDAVRRVDAALRTLAAAHRPGEGQDGRRRDGAGVGQPSPGPIPQLLFRHPNGDIEVLLREPCDVIAEPWQSLEDSRIWQLPASSSVPPDVGQDLPHPCPALVQLGTTSQGCEVYLDLEAVGVLRLDVRGREAEGDGPGRVDGATAKGIARAVTATLAVSHLAGVPSVRTSGFDPFGLANEKRVYADTSVDDVVAQVEKDLLFIRHWLRDSALSTSFALRAARPSDTWDPTIAVLAGPAISDDLAERLVSLADGGGRGLAVVLPPGVNVDVPWALVLRPGADGAERETTWLLKPAGIELTPLSVAADELRDLTALLAEAAAPPVPVPVDTPEADHDANDGPAPPRPADAVPERGTATDRGTVMYEPDWQVMVRLLGPVDVIGRDGRPPVTRVRERSLQALAWLVTHRRNGTRADLEAAIWPDGVEQGTITNVLGRARGALEQLAGPDARDWIPAHQPMSIDPAVISDLDIVERRLRYAKHHRKEPEEAISVLRGALRLIRGAPARYEWLDAELGSTLTTVPVRAVELLAELCLEQGDTEGVLEATAVGLGLIPAHSGLVAYRMRARADGGDRAGVRAEYEAYARAERANPLTGGEVDPEVERLFMDLIRNPRDSSPPPRRGDEADEAEGER
jgi:nucleoid-associated protein YgaU